MKLVVIKPHNVEKFKRREDRLPANSREPVMCVYPSQIRFNKSAARLIDLGSNNIHFELLELTGNKEEIVLVTGSVDGWKAKALPYGYIIFDVALARMLHNAELNAPRYRIDPLPSRLNNRFQLTRIKSNPQ